MCPMPDTPARANDPGPQGHRNEPGQQAGKDEPQQPAGGDESPPPGHPNEPQQPAHAHAERPSRPTIDELRAVTQPPAVRGRKNSEHWVADVYLRRISPYLTRILLPTGVSANTVTWFMIVTGASAGLALVVPGIPGALLALL